MQCGVRLLLRGQDQQTLCRTSNYRCVIDKLLDHMERKAIASMTIYWQGGEIMILPPAWFERAHDLIQEAAAARGKRIAHSLQSNMIGYNKRWNTIIAEMFGNSVGTSMDFPNLYRQARNGTPEQYTAIWSRNVRAARQAGIDIGVIAIPNKGTLQVGAERFYTYFRRRARDHRLSDQHLFLRRGAQ